MAWPAGVPRRKGRACEKERPCSCRPGGRSPRNGSWKKRTLYGFAGGPRRSITSGQHSQFVKLPIEIAFADAEHSRGVPPVAAAKLQRFDDVGSFRFIERREPVLAGWNRRGLERVDPADRLRQVIGQDLV